MSHDCDDPARKRLIRERNDQLRQAPFDTWLDQVVLTESVDNFLRSAPGLLPREWLARRLYLLRALAAFDAFDETIDPCLEHDFGFSRLGTEPSSLRSTTPTAMAVKPVRVPQIRPPPAGCLPSASPRIIRRPVAGDQASAPPAFPVYPPMP